MTGAIARTATNFRSGARTPVAGLVHALTLLVIVLVLAPLARTCRSRRSRRCFRRGYNMGEWREIGSIWRLEWADKSVWIITFALTVMADLTLAVEVGMALAALLYIYRVTDTTSIVARSRRSTSRMAVRTSCRTSEVPPYVTILRIHGPVSVRHDGQARGRHGRPVGVRADRHPAPAQYDGHRRDGPARDRGPERSAAAGRAAH